MTLLKGIQGAPARTNDAPAPANSAPAAAVGVPAEPARAPTEPVAPSPVKAFLHNLGANPSNDAERKALVLAKVPGQLATPNVVFKPADVLQQLQNGTLTVRVPLISGAEIGPVKVRDNTFAVFNLNVKDGKIERHRTDVAFVDADNRPTSLDGPVWVDPTSVYVDAQGAIRADAKCFPNPNITSSVLGPDVSRLPENVGDLGQLLLARANLAQTYTIIPERKTDLSLATTHTTGNPDGDANAKSPDAPASTPGATAKAPSATTKTKVAATGLSAALDMARTTIDFSGTLKAGPVQFGSGAVLNLGEGAAVHCSGTLGDLHTQIDAPVKSMQLAADETRIRSGSGRVQFTLGLAREFGGPQPGLSDVDLKFTDLQLTGLDIETPGATRKHHLVMQTLDVRGTQATAPVLHYRTARAGHDSRVTLTLPEVRLEGLAGNLELTGSDGAAASLQLGVDTSGNRRAVNVMGRLEMDSASEHFLFDSRIDHLNAVLSPLALVDSAGFEMKLSGGDLSGSGRIKVESTAGKATLTLQSDAGQRFSMASGIADAKIGATLQGSQVHVDVGEETHGYVALDTLTIGGAQPPVFKGDAEFTVTLDSLELQVPGEHRLTVARGTTGTLVISDMGWQPGEASPTVTATLKLNLGAQALFRPGEIPGLEGAKVSVDTKTGNTMLELTATVDKFGNVRCAAGIALKAFEVKTQLAKGGMPVIADVNIPTQRLTPEMAPTLKSVRPLTPSTAHKPPVLQGDTPTPKLPPITLDPANLFGALKSAQLDLQIPVDAFKTHIRTADSLETKTGWFGDDRVGARVDLEISHAGGNATFRLAIEKGAVVPARTRLVATPSIQIAVDMEKHFVGPVTLGASPTFTLNGFTIEDRGDGTGQLIADASGDKTWLKVMEGVLPGNLHTWVGNVVGGILLGRITPANVDNVANTAWIAMHGGTNLPLDAQALLKSLKVGQAALAPQTFNPLPAPTLSLPQPSKGGAPQTHAPVSPATNASKTAPAMPSGFETLFRAVHLDQATVSVKDAVFAGKTIALGNGQSITLGTNSQLALTGTPQDFKLSGHANLGAIKLGGKELGATLQSGEADLEIHYQARDHAAPLITIALTHLRATSLSAIGVVRGANAAVRDLTVTNGSIRVTTDASGTPNLTLDLPHVQGKLVAGGRVGAAGASASAQAIEAEVSGSLRLAEGRLQGDLDQIKLLVKGLSASTSPGKVAGADLTLSGAATVSVSDTGELVLAKRGTGFKLTADFVPPSGDRYTLTNMTADSVRFATSAGMAVTLNNATGELATLVRLPLQSQGRDAPVLDLRHAHVRGSATLTAKGLTTVGAVTIDEADGSIANMQLDAGRRALLDLAQLDFAGSGTLTVSPEKGWLITDANTRGASATPGGIRAMGVARDIRFATDSPEITVDLKNGAQAEFDLHKLQFGAKRPAAIAVSRGHFSGEVEVGKITIGRGGDLLDNISLNPGTLVAADVGEITSGEFAGLPAMAARLDVSMRLEGRLGDAGGRLKNAEVNIEKLNINGDFRMLVRAKSDGRGNFTARSHTIVDQGQAGMVLRSKVNPKTIANQVLDAAVKVQPTTLPKPRR